MLRTTFAVSATVALSLVSAAGCKPRQSESAVKSFEAGASLEAILESLEREAAAVEPKTREAPEIGSDTGMNLTGETEADPKLELYRLIDQLNKLVAKNPGASDLETAKQLSLDLQALSQLIDTLSADDMERVKVILGKVDQLVGAAEVAAAKKAAEAKAAAENPNKRTVDGYAVECQVHPNGDKTSGMNWSLVANGKWIEHSNGMNEMMTQRDCQESLKHIKNGLICAGRASNRTYVRVNGIYRLANQLPLTTLNGFAGNRYEYCYQAIDRSTDMQVCAWIFNKEYAIQQINHALPWIKDTFPDSVDGWNTCLSRM